MNSETLNTDIMQISGIGTGEILFMFTACLCCLGFCLYRKRRLSRKHKQKEENAMESAELAVRRLQVINKQILSLDRCSKEIAVLTDFFDRKVDSITATLEDKLCRYRELSGFLKEIEESLSRSAASIDKNAILLARRDKELKNEIETLLALEGKSKGKNSYGLKFDDTLDKSAHLTDSIDTIAMPPAGKKTLKRQFGCQTLEDVLSVMLLLQKKRLREDVIFIGEKSICALEGHMAGLGLLTVENDSYTSGYLLKTGD